MKVLLHICCAPCAIYPLEELRTSGHQAAAFFYNPNIHPYSEYLKRKAEVEKLAAENGTSVIYGAYDFEEFFQNIVYNEAGEDRCPICWWMRLEKTAALAKQAGCDAFTTTLLGSPYQDQAIIKAIGEEVAKNKGLQFYCADFAKGFKEAHRIAREKGIYCQNYCGCLYSEVERLDKGRAKKQGAAEPEARTITLSVTGSKKKIKCRM